MRLPARLRNEFKMRPHLPWRLWLLLLFLMLLLAIAVFVPAYEVT